VSESRVTWATYVPILVFLGLSVLELQTSDRRQTKASHNASALWGRRHNNNRMLDFFNGGGLKRLE